MPLARPVPTDDTPPPPFTIVRADVTGMDPGTAHEAILGAFDAGVLAATAAAGMVDQAIIDAKVAELTADWATCAAHEPYQLVDHDESTPDPTASRCLAEGADVLWPCPTYRLAAATIADGLGR